MQAGQILNLVNLDREKHGLSDLSLNPTLNLAAYAKAEDMISKNYFAHVSPGGVKPWDWFKNLGYNYSYAGENLAEGYSDPYELENSWMNSPTHRANILSPFYSEAGLAVVSRNNTTIIVQFFGSKENKVSLRQ
ncbi:MAG: CAP domain-containing protein [Candidatus Doudnabacteria bacterium]